MKRTAMILMTLLLFATPAYAWREYKIRPERPHWPQYDPGPPGTYWNPWVVVDENDRVIRRYRPEHPEGWWGPPGSYNNP